MINLINKGDICKKKKTKQTKKTTTTKLALAHRIVSM